MKFGERLKRRRQELKMSAEELGKIIGKNRATIYRYEKGDIENVPVDVVEPLAKALDTTPTWIMGWDHIADRTDDELKNNDVDVKFVGSVGEVIKSLRMMKNISLEEFSDETGVPVDKLKRYETGESNIPKRVMENLADFLNVTVEDLTSANITVNKIHIAYVSNSPTHVRHLKLWYDAVGDVVLEDEEIEKIIEYAKFLLYLRDE